MLSLMQSCWSIGLDVYSTMLLKTLMAICQTEKKKIILEKKNLEN